MPENQQPPRHISTRAASSGHSAALDTEQIRRAIESLQESSPPHGGTKAPIKDAAPLFRDEPMFYDQDNDPDFPAAGHKGGKKGKKKKKDRGDWIFIVLTLVFTVTLFVSGGLLVKRYLDDRKTQDDFALLQELIPTPAPAPAEGDARPTPDPNRFAALLAQNPECIGWISIEYTELSYPVMYSPTRENFYLKHDFEGNYSDYGVPYLDEDCTLTADSRSNNLIIYGHNMKTGILFRPLTGYLEEDFYKVHPTVHLDTLYDSSDYEVFAAFEIDVVDDPDFVYNEYYDMDEQTFDWFVNEVISRSPVKSGIRPAWGDELLTLSTCEYSTDNGRLVVCARRVEPDTGSDS